MHHSKPFNKKGFVFHGSCITFISMQFLLYSHIFISLCAVAMAIETYAEFNKKISAAQIPVLVIIFFATYAMYNFKVLWQHIKPFWKIPSIGSAWIEANRKFIYLFFLTGVVCASISAFFLTGKQLFLFFLLSIISAWYYLPFLNISLIKIPFLKIFLISLVWNAVTVVIPVLGFDEIPADFLFYFIYKFIWILALAVVFDIKDKSADKDNGIFTLPVLVGNSNTKKISILMLLAGMVFSYITMSFWFFVIALISSIFAIKTITKVNAGTESKYYLLQVDGLVLLQSVLNIIAVLASQRTDAINIF